MNQENKISESYSQLNKLFEHRSRLTICALLAQHDQIAFSRFKTLLKETDGNLGAQLRKLEDAGYISVSKEFQDRRPVSWYMLTESGKQALQQHLKSLNNILGTN